MLAFIAAAASAETPCEGIPAGVACALPNSQSVTADLTIGEVKTYKLVLGVNVCSDPTRWIAPARLGKGRRGRLPRNGCSPRARVQAGAPDIQLVLTRLSGNPDLFASFTEPVPTDAAATHPNPDPYPNPSPLTRTP